MKRLYIIAILCFSTVLAHAQKFGIYDKVTIPIVKIPNSTVAPTQPNSLYAKEGHLYWNDVRMDTLHGMIVLTDTVGADPTCSGLVIYSLADSAAWQKSYKIDSITGDTTGCEWVDVSTAKWLSNGTTLYYGDGDVQVNKTIFASSIYPKPGTAAINLRAPGLEGNGDYAAVQVWGTEGGLVNAYARRTYGADYYSSILRLSPLSTYLAIQKNGLARQKVTIDSSGMYPEIGELDLGTTVKPWDTIYANSIPGYIAYNDSLTRNLSHRVISLSAAGIKSDAVLSIGSTIYGLDQTQAIQTILNKAGANPLTIIWDVMVSINDTGLRVLSNTQINVMPGCGAILRPGITTYAPILCNANRYVSAADSNIIIHGGIWNHNKSGSPSNTGHAIEFQRCKNVLLDQGIRIIDSKNFALDVRNCTGFTIQNFTIDNGTYSGSTGNDGIHFWGWNSDITIRDGIITAYDDNIAFYSDYYLTSTKDEDKSGPITNVVIDNIILRNGINGLKLVSGAERIDNVVIRNITGSTDVYALIIDEFTYRSGGWSGGPGNFGTIQIENFNVDLNSHLSGYVLAGNVYVACNVEKLIFRDLKKPTPSLWSNKPGLIVSNDGGSTTVIKDLIIDGYDSYDSTLTANSTSHILIDSATVTNLQIQRATVDVKNSADIPSSLLRLTGGATLSNVMLNAININKIKYVLFNESGSISSVVANNIIHTNADTSFRTNSTIASLVLSNYKGAIPTKGTFTTRSGDATITSSSAVLHTNRNSEGYGFIFTNWLKNKNQSTAGQSVDSASFWQYIYPSGAVSYGIRSTTGSSRLSIDTARRLYIYDTTFLPIEQVAAGSGKSLIYTSTGTYNIVSYSGTPTIIGQKAGGTKSTPTKATAESRLLDLQGSGYQQTTGAFTSSKARITLVAIEDFTSTANGTAIDFAVTPAGSTTQSVKARLNATGLGLGTTSPSEMVDVAGNIKTTGEVKYAVSPASDHTCSGDVISLTAATTQAIGDVVYIASTGKATLCDADAIATCPYALAVCADASISADAAGDYMTKGVIRDDTWNWTVGGLIYVAAPGGSASSGSTLTQTAPSGANNVIIPVGVALSADIMYFFGNINTVEKQ